MDRTYGNYNVTDPDGEHGKGETRVDTVISGMVDAAITR
jgi:hypothetical protein